MTVGTTSSGAIAPASAWAQRFPWLAIAVIVGCQLMLVLDGTIVTVALPHIRDEFGFSDAALSWVLTAYSLAFGGLILLSGKVSAVIGPRRALVIGTVIFTVGSIVGGIAPAGEILILARVIQGAGAALAAPSTLVLMMSNTPEGPARVRAMSFFVMASSAGAVIGLLAGGVLTSTLGWRSVMLVNVPIGLLLVFAAPIFLRENERETGRRFDVAGAVTSTLGMTALVYGFTTAASQGWTTPSTLLIFALALALLVVFYFVERSSENPVVPLGLLASMPKAAPFLIMLFVPAGMMSFFFFATLFLQDVLGFGPLQTGFGFLPFVITLLISGTIAPDLIGRFGERRVALAGLTVVAAGLLLMSQSLGSGNYLTGMLGPMILFGAGPGLVFTSITTVIMERAEAHHTGSAASLLQSMQQIGGALGIAVLTTIFTGVALTSGVAVGIGMAVLGSAVFGVLGLLLALRWVHNAQAQGAERKVVVAHGI